MATKKKGGKGRKHVVEGVGKSAVSKLGPPPGVPALPKVNIDLGIKGIKSDLAQARREGKRAAKGQLASIDERISKVGQRQSARYDQRTDKIMRNMKRLDRQSRLFAGNRQAGINATNQNIMRNATQVPGGGGALDIGITGNRSTMLRSQGKATGELTQAGRQAGRAMKQAGQAAVDATPRIQTTSSKNAMSILDVLAAERKSDDVRYLSELRMQERQLELSQAHDMRMAQMNFQNDLYMQKYSQALNMDYMDWQYKQGYLETPDQQRAEEFKYFKMEQDYVNKIEQKKDKDGSFRAYSKGIDVGESVIAQASTVMSDPKFDSRVQQYVAARRAKGEVVDPNTARAEFLLNNINYNVPEDQVNVARNIAAQMARTGTTPTFTDVEGYVEQNDDLAAKYVQTGSPAKKNRIHQNYRALNAAVLGTEQYKAVANVPDEGIAVGDVVPTDASVLPAGTVPLSGPGPGGPGPDDTPDRPDEAGANYAPAAGIAAGTGATVAALRAAKARAALTPGMTTAQALGESMVEGGETIKRLVRQGYTVDQAREAVSRGAGQLASVIKGNVRDKISRGVVSPFARPNAADEILREIGSIAEADQAMATQVDRANMRGSVRGDAPIGAADEAGEGFIDRARKVMGSEAGEATVGTLKQGAKAAGKLAPVVGVAAEAAYWGERLMDDRRDTQSRHENNYHDMARAFMDSPMTEELFSGVIEPKDYHERVRAMTIERDDDYFTDEEKWNLYQYGVKTLHRYYAKQRGE